MTELICKICGERRDVGRRLCRSCNIKRVNSYPRYTWAKICEACGGGFKAWYKRQKLCKDCYSLMLEINRKNISNNNYVFTNIPGRTKHRDIAEKVLCRKLKTNEVVHHLDGNPKNNDLVNLIVVSRRTHGKLHHFLELQRVIIEKFIIDNSENCWNSLIVPMTTAWLETTSAKVIKIWEIGQSAAELLSNGEGSETLHGTPVTDVAVGEDIVQTTT